MGLGTRLLPVDNGRRTNAAFEAVTSDLTYREYPVAHGVSEAEMRDVAGWLAARLDAQPTRGS